MVVDGQTLSLFFGSIVGAFGPKRDRNSEETAKIFGWPLDRRWSKGLETCQWKALTSSSANFRHATCMRLSESLSNWQPAGDSRDEDGSEPPSLGVFHTVAGILNRSMR